MDHLQGLRVVDVSQNLAGPYCTQILADLGAEVTKVEPPAGDSARAWAPPLWGGQSPLFLSVNRNKRSIQIDLKSEKGKEVLWKLIDDSDVFVQAYRAGVIERLGFDSGSVRARRPGMIYVSVTAYGPTGPLQDQPGYDPLMQAYSGLMSITGHDAEAPARVGASVKGRAPGRAFRSPRRCDQTPHDRGAVEAPAGSLRAMLTHSRHGRRRER